MTSANQPALALPTSRAEQETQNEARRLTMQIDEALVAIANRENDETLEASANRIERTARDFVHALRELAQERSSADSER